MGNILVVVISRIADIAAGIAIAIIQNHCDD